MGSLKVVSLRRHSYCGHPRHVGSEYYVRNEKDLRFLEAIKRVRRVPDVVVKDVKPAPVIEPMFISAVSSTGTAPFKPVTTPVKSSEFTGRKSKHNRAANEATKKD